MLELVNRMRANPAAELPILLNSNDPNVTSALSYFNVNLSVLQSQWSTLTSEPPLAWNDILATTALNHDQAMLAAGAQSHQLPGEADLGTRISNAGYANWSYVGENIFAYASSIFSAHAAFAIDWGSTPTGIQNPPGHRENIMDPGFRDVGIGVLDAPGNPNVGPLLITQDFGNRFSYGNPYLLGTVFNDANSNGYYDQGEGLGSVTLTITGAGGTVTTTTTAYGGYQLQLAPGTYTITASGGALFGPITNTVTIGANNVHLNFIRGSQPQQNATSPFADNFNRANSSFIGAYWSQQQGSFKISNNVLVGADPGVSQAVVNGLSVANVGVQADVVVGMNQAVNLMARYQASTGGNYFASIYNFGSGPTAVIYSYVSGVGYTQLGASVSLASGVGTLRFETVGSSLKVYFGPDAAHLSLVAYAFDTAITGAGQTGVRILSNATVDNFTTDTIVPTAPTSFPFTDTFTQNDGAQLSRNWTEQQGNFRVNNGALVGAAPGLSQAVVNVLSVANVSVQADVVVGMNQVINLMARYKAGTGSNYFASIYNIGSGPTAVIYSYVSGVGYMQLGTTVSLASGVGTVRFEVVGSSLKVYFGPDAGHLSLVAYAFDTAIAGVGQTGVRILSNATVDNFTTDTIVPTVPASLPFTDTFTQSNGAQLSRNWTEQQGNFNVNGGVLVAVDPGLSQAVVNGLSVGNVSVQADVTLGMNQAINLMARYQAGTGSFYFASIYNFGSGPTAVIYSYVAGVGYTQLGASTALGTSVGTMRFVLAGSSLKLFFGADAAHLALVNTVTDTTISAAGLIGIRALQNARLANFTVS